jgi:nitrite reductase/ring-hydroxylating ferredoxin subunit
VVENTTKSSEIQRRQFLQRALAVAAVPPLCCVTPALTPDAIAFEPGRLSVNLAVAPELRRAGTAVSIVNQERKINLILIHAERGNYVAMDRSCTHGGAQCTYNSRRRTLQCTSLNHAEYDLQGTLLHGRTHGNLRTYQTAVTPSSVEISLETGA